MNLDETELPENMFEARCPLNCTIHTSTWHWFTIREKHSDHDFTVEDIEKCIADPDIIVKSLQDDNVFLCYKIHDKHLLVSVCKKLNGKGFLITAYLTDKIKKGEILWQN